MQESYREIFLSESQEYLKNISNCLVRLENNAGDIESLNEIFRCTHTLKGMSATMGYDKIAQLSHQMENLLDELRSQRKEVTTEIIDILFTCTDVLEQFIQDIRLKRDSTIEIVGYVAALQKFLTGDIPAEKTRPLTATSTSKEIELDPADQAKAKAAQDSGLNVCRAKILIAENCLMKEARAFLIITHLQRLGEILQANPSIEDIKAGRFEQAFTIFLISKESKEAIHKDILNISEVEAVSIVPVETEMKTHAVKHQAPQGQAAAQAQTEHSYIKKIQSMRIPVQRLDRIMNLIGELTIAKIQLVQQVQSAKIEPLEEISLTLDRLTSTLQDEMMQTRLLPASYVLDPFGRVVRDLSKKQNKEVDLEITGSEIELDRVVLEEIGDPLIHLLRNAIDHGIESPEERQAKGKDPKGKIAIKVSRQKGQISIEISDNGRGVSVAKVKEKAIKKGIITELEAENLDDKKILDIIALPGFSTAKEVTDISGRGVGLDVVKIKLESLGGRLDFESKLDVGTRFFLTLPLTLAIIKAMLVQVQGEILAVPLMNIRETIKIKRHEIKLVQNFQVIKVRDEVIPILHMDKELGIPSVSDELETTNDGLPLVIIEYEKRALGLMVNKIVGEQDIVVKPLPSFVKKTKGIAGATILGDGRVALILDIMSLRG
ncbi:MAG: hypothetical protein A2Y00_05090 [Omnitrophica WOR_2 bacterium GWF2_43_52]|nr:MAG: hypothetical protein A2Y01_01920 [Omnitrophica WOR_2 bacterium GWC2_44_8]OGX20482.1 MAG: hypothetical protein A2Y00_05090 [Omnitrophica WOR_2 bacterium GWF2_43_52]OGX53378.1 MAG: hypothetical protein A2460_05350 [Omnitrophica WOR_2 bacterium RIFOXYC2_FULL_43_9]HAH20537.1 chemotaxis protein CheA [Candidatus Omnitrophota bacterium]HBG62800.1 chemotaxis protein CheA [Candidatus Omnitrophota bacterium]